jgi:peroxiredoxin
MNRPIFAVLLVVVMIFTQSLAAESSRNDIHSDATLVQPIMPGMDAPAFSVKDANGDAVSFAPDQMEKPLVLSFFRGGWCPYCNLNLSEMRLAEKELRALGFDIWFVSVDSPEMIYASLQEPDIGYVVLSDARLEATRAFGIAFTVPDEMVKRYVEYGIDLEKASGETHHVLPAPSIFIIGNDGKITFQYTNPDYRVRLHPDVLLAAARAYTEDADLRLNSRLKAIRAEKKD